MTIFMRDTREGLRHTKYYKVEVTRQWVNQHNNGAMISCGMLVGGDLSGDEFNRMSKNGQVTEITRDEWNHSGCQSSCVKRGDRECRW